MFSKQSLLGLLAISLTCVVVNGTSADRFALSQHAILQTQVALHTVKGPASPESKTMESGGISRSYSISVPSDYDECLDKEWPLIVDFHGRGGTAEGQWDDSQYYLNPSGKEYFVVYPNGCLGAGDNSGPPESAWQGAPYANTSCNDLSFVSDLVNLIERSYRIDSTRIYASGISNGGGFVDTLACSSTGDLFAAFAMAAAALYTDTLIPPDHCTGKRPRMILESHGTEDDMIPINGRMDPSNPKYTTPNIAQWTGRWAERNGCKVVEDCTITSQSWGMNTTYSCNGLTNIVQQYRVTNLGHCWASLTDNTDSYNNGASCSVHTLDFTQAVIEFFAQSSKVM